MTTPPERRRPPEPSPADDVVILRLPRAADEDAIAAACTDPEIARWIPVPIPYTRSDARAFLDLAADGWADGTQATFVIEERAGGRLAGMIGLDRGPTPGRASVGYWLAPGARGRGLATRAVRLLSAWAFEDPGLERLELMTLVGNDASGRVARRAGFRREGTLRRYLPFRETLVDAVMYARLRGDAPDAATAPARDGARDGAARLADALDDWDRATAALGALAAAGGGPAAPLAAEVLDALRDEVSRRAWDPPSIEPRDAADRRDAVALLLGGLGMADPAEPAGALVALGWDGNEIDDLLAPFDDDEARLVVAAWLASAALVHRLLAEMSGG